MDRNLWPSIPALIVLLVMALPGAGAQETWALNAETQLKTMVDQVLVIIRDPELTAAPDRQEQVLYDKAFEIFDFDTFSRFALGPKYREFSNAQVKDFILYFSKMISRTYFPKLAGKDVQNLQINYLKNNPYKPKHQTYKTDISTELIQGEIQIPVVYRMIKSGQAPWLIYDIKIEGVSMAANYNEQYRQQINATPDQIIAQLKEKVSQ